jgi:hypothetical protein
MNPAGDEFQIAAFALFMVLLIRYLLKRAEARWPNRFGEDGHKAFTVVAVLLAVTIAFSLLSAIWAGGAFDGFWADMKAPAPVWLVLLAALYARAAASESGTLIKSEAPLAGCSR